MESEVNETAGVENTSNVTGRDAATPEGIAITYGSLFLMALLPLFFGSLRSVGYHTGLKTRGEEAGDRIGMRDAAMFPVYASGGLFGLYLFFKFLPKEYVNTILSALFLLLGISALTRALSSIVNPFIPDSWKAWFTQYSLHLTVTTPGKESEESRLKFTTIDVILAVGSALLGLGHLLSNHWLSNNVFGLAFCLNAIEMISLDSVGVGALLLGGLFLYDIFWVGSLSEQCLVFGTDVMVTVAKSFEAPIKLMFPMDILEKGLGANNFGMLGLGDIVIPGLLIALLCRFDKSHHPKGIKVYFYSGFLAYVLGLGTTIAVMHTFKAAQPALLYLVPSCLGLPLFMALIRGDISDMFKYRDYPEKKEAKESKED
ncbi:Minor histocompatibility antigen H13 [Geodia barretti]|uniref:Minor histocompatibility antigen H13 n=1 Tax=Geodia barretti TaxID=519541 RepID=A0AA35U115_GEOBA|nr:Minor histocompatibility antigen H13 [Geodia barretti]